MPVPVSVEERALNLLMAALATIGTGSTGWLTQATGMTIQKKVPGDPLPQPTKPAAYVQYISTDMIDSEGGAMGSHRWRIRLGVWITGATVEMMLNGKRDVCMAMFGAEDAYHAAFGDHLYPENFVYQSDMESTGIAVGLLMAHVEATVDHNAP